MCKFWQLQYNSATVVKYYSFHLSLIVRGAFARFFLDDNGSDNIQKIIWNQLFVEKIGYELR